MRILVIDDEPVRCSKLVRDGHMVAIAHTIDQILFWLRHGPWDMIMLDHDLNRSYNGHDLCRNYGVKYIGFGCPVRIWSLNPGGAINMAATLHDLSEQHCIDVDIRIQPFGSLAGDMEKQ